MPKRNYDDFGGVYTLLAVQSTTGDGTFMTGSGVDCKGCSKGVLLMHIGDGMTGTGEYKLQHSVDNSTWATHSVHSTTGSTVTIANINSNVALEVNDIRRYLRILYKQPNTKQYDHGVTFVGWDARKQPLP